MLPRKNYTSYDKPRCVCGHLQTIHFGGKCAAPGCACTSTTEAVA